MRVTVQDADAILEPLVLGILLVAVDPVDGCPEQRRGHLEGDACARACLVEQSLGSPEDSRVQPDELRPVSRRRGKLEVEVDARKQGRGHRAPVERPERG